MKNQIKNKISFPYQVLNWREYLKESNEDKMGKFDLVLGSDILYESQHPNQVAKALISLLGPGGKIILSDPGRAYVQKFLTSMQELGYPEKMTIQKVEAKLTLKNKEREIFIFEF